MPSTKILTLLAAILLLAAAPGTSKAEWEQINISAGGSALFIDMETLRIDRNYRRVWVLRNFPEPESGGGQSRATLMNFDCEEERARVLSTATYSGLGGTGSVIPESGPNNATEWGYMPPNSIGADLMAMVCGIPQN